MATPDLPPDPPGPLDSVAGPSEPAARLGAVQHLQIKAALLLALTVALVVGSALYLLYARGYFEPKQTLVLVTDNAEGVAAGQDLSFSGFPIGTVRNVSLGDKGNVRITIDVNRKDARWLRTSSIFTLVRGLVGGAQLRAYSGVLTDPPLPDGAERPVLRGDANEELQRVIGTARDLMDNLHQITAAGSDLQRTLAHLQAFAHKLQGPKGALHAVFGNEEDARKLVQTIERANAALARVDGLVGSADRLVQRADAQVFGPEGLSNEARATVRQFQGLLVDARGNLQRVDELLKEAQGVAANVRTGTADLDALRADVEASLRKVQGLLDDINRRWPFATQREVQLP